MDFVTIQTRVAEEVGLVLADDATKIKAWINGAYQQLSGFYDWPWLKTNFTVQTEKDITTGTVSINAGSTSGTFSSAPAASVATNYMIQFTGASNDWYYISAHTGASTSFTIANSFTGTSNYSGAYIVRRVFYSLPATVDRVTEDMRQSTSPASIPWIDPATFDHLVPDPSATGTPRVAYLTGMTTSNVWQFGLYPTPNVVMNLQGRGLKTITELTADADLPLIPPKWHNVLVFLALALYGHDYIDDLRVQSAAERAKEIVKEMVKQSNPLPGQMNVIQPWDTRVRRPYGPQLPSNYPWIGWY